MSIDSSPTAEPFAPASLNALFAARAKTHRDKIFLCVPRPGFDNDASTFAWDEYTYGQIDQLLNQLCASYAAKLPPKRRNIPTRTVAILAPSSFDYALNALALYRAGHCVVYLSTNNSTAALAHLVRITKTKHVLYSDEQSKAAAALKVELGQQELGSVEIMRRNTVAEAVSLSLAASMDRAQYISELTSEEEASEKASVLHSSGSTSFPKPSTFTHHESANKLFTTGATDTFSTMPLFHVSGFNTLLSPMLSTKKLYMYTSRLTADLIAAAIGRSTAKQAFIVPFVLKLLAESPAGLRALQSFTLVTFGGAACPTAIGNTLVNEHNVALQNGIGSTEAGFLLSSARDFATDKEWEYVRPILNAKDYIAFENTGTDKEGPYEMVVLPGFPSLTESNRPDGSYATRDLFVKHPTREGLWKYAGRADDTLVHYNGEKTNPVPMELAIRASLYVADCLIFGAGRSQTGILVVPSEKAFQQAETQASSQTETQRLEKLIWSAVESGNAEAPSHSQIIPELVMILPAGTKLPAADKGSLIRAKVARAFEREIDELYAKYDAGPAEGAKMTLTDETASVTIVAEILAEVVGTPSKQLETELRDADLITLGVDSLQATRIRNLLQQRVRLQSALPANLVFEHPTVAKLAKCVLKHSRGEGSSSQEQDRAEIESALALLEEMKGRIITRDAKLASDVVQKGTAKQTVVLTGSTGSLGAHLLHQLAHLDMVERVICLNRAPTDADALERTDSSLQVRKLDTLDALATSTQTSILCFAAQLDKPHLGLNADAWQLVSTTTTAVIDNGWPVNFNMSISSFRSPIVGSVALINLVAGTPATLTPRYIYSSSVSAAMNTGSSVEESVAPTIQQASPLGYGRSKWIVEQLCAYAQHHVGGGFDAVLARIGQMVGDRKAGVWNETEAMPLTIKSAQVVGCLPDLPGNISWQPVDDSAFIIARLLLPERLQGVVHVLNPATVPWRQVVQMLRVNLGGEVEMVDPTEWVRRLEESDPDPARNPTIKLLEFFRASPGGGLASDQVYSTERLREVFADLGLKQQLEERLVPTDAELVGKIVAAWKASGFLK
ncbi:AMP-dependent synthetase/ligase [Kalmanozyma brasiliensis GHG001]|uniref:Carrier domain-containing protein n=1 Tax=Kalmanozyma brasiliensis (strain GHG001) TaxID=1365824 RepID=V5EY46_KALBG|nr:AMP-dependent synthetase/ligase [Kalmanozyma brasiliensis GHG001]EST08578.1 AMP-dependent synthetase/ligase [Kalmanozyma brasiliensis GHG001]